MSNALWPNCIHVKIIFGDWHIMKPSWLHYTWFAYQRPLTTGAGHCLQWVLTSATAAVVLITIVECSGDQPRSSDSGCRIWGLTILWYGNHTCVLGTYGMVWHGILACTWSPLTIASLARNWFWDGNCNCLLCLCTPLPTPSTHIRYMYQFDKHFSGPPKPNMKKKTLKPGWTSLHWLKTQGITCPNYHLQSKPTHKRSI